MFRMFFMTFTGEYRGGEVHPHNCPPAMVWPLGALAIPSVLSGWLGVPLGSAMDWFAGKSEAPNPFSAFVYYVQPHFEAANPGMMLASARAAPLSGFAFWRGFLVYEKQTVSINTVIASSTNALLSWLYKFSFNKWYIFDEIYYLGARPVDVALYKAAWSLIDMFIVDGIVNGSGLVTETCGQLLKYTENGRAQSYALVIFSFVTVLTLVVYFFPASLKPLEFQRCQSHLTTLITNQQTSARARGTSRTWAWTRRASGRRTDFVGRVQRLQDKTAPTGLRFSRGSAGLVMMMWLFVSSPITATEEHNFENLPPVHSAQ